MDTNDNITNQEAGAEQEPSETVNTTADAAEREITESQGEGIGPFAPYCLD